MDRFTAPWTLGQTEGASLRRGAASCPHHPECFAAPNGQQIPLRVGWGGAAVVFLDSAPERKTGNKSYYPVMTSAAAPNQPLALGKHICSQNLRNKSFSFVSKQARNTNKAWSLFSASLEPCKHSCLSPGSFEHKTPQPLV